MVAKDDSRAYIGAIFLTGLAFVVIGYQMWSTQQESHRLKFLNTIYSAENSLLKDEIKSYESKPSYEQGYKDALIRVGGPQTVGAYADGWDDAFKLFGEENDYAEGYHAAIQQFGYTKSANQKRWLIPDMPQTDDPTVGVKTANYTTLDGESIREPKKPVMVHP